MGAIFSMSVCLYLADYHEYRKKLPLQEKKKYLNLKIVIMMLISFFVVTTKINIDAKKILNYWDFFSSDMKRVNPKSEAKCVRFKFN